MIEPYDLEPDPEMPSLPGEVMHRPLVDRAYELAAADLLVYANNCVRSFGDFHLALSVGKPQTKLYLCMMTDPAFRGFPWAKTHVWLTSEYELPTSDERSRFGEISEILADHSGIPRNQLHAVRWPGAAGSYEKKLQETLAWREPGQDRLDAAVLAIDPNGSPDGIFLENEAVETPELVRGIASGVLPGSPEVSGVTMTPRLLRGTRLLSVLAVGESGHQGIQRLKGPEGRVLRQLFEDFAPVGGTMKWYLDDVSLTGQPQE